MLAPCMPSSQVPEMAPPWSGAGLRIPSHSRTRCWLQSTPRLSIAPTCCNAAAATTPPPGASPYLGLEMAGTVAEVGPRAQGFAVGDRVCSILPGGGYAEAVAADPSYLMPLPEALSFTEGGGLPEVFLTAYVNLFMEAGLAAGETGAHPRWRQRPSAPPPFSSRAGPAPPVCVTARSEAKLEACRKLGAQGHGEPRHRGLGQGDRHRHRRRGRDPGLRRRRLPGAQPATPGGCADAWCSSPPWAGNVVEFAHRRPDAQAPAPRRLRAALP